MSELERNKFEVIPLSAEAPHSDVEAEARTKQRDYIVYTTPTAEGAEQRRTAGGLAS